MPAIIPLPVCDILFVHCIEMYSFLNMTAALTSSNYDISVCQRWHFDQSTQVCTLHWLLVNSLRSLHRNTLRLRSLKSKDTFKRHLKTHYFKLAFQHKLYSAQSLVFRSHCFIVCFNSCTALLDIFVYWCTTSALLLLLLLLLVWRFTGPKCH